MNFSDGDRQALAARGIPVEEAERQRDLLTRPPRFTRLARPCTVGDGIVRLDETQGEELLELQREAADRGRFLKFVPASGAATRMFKELLHFHRGSGSESELSTIREEAAAGGKEAAALARFLDEIVDFPFLDDLERAYGGSLREGVRNDGFRAVLAALLDPGGLDYAARPKGLLVFHRYQEGSRTSFEEHLVEAAEYARDGEGRCRLHFTVSPEHRAGFDRLFRTVAPNYEKRLDVRYEVNDSVQKPSTDTIAVDASGQPLRDADGQLLFRPGGHGALIENLADLEGDLVYVKNIDNVQPDHLREPTRIWKRMLAGHLVHLERRAHGYVAQLRRAEGPAAVLADALRFAREELNIAIGEREASSTTLQPLLLDRLDRPLRVCGVVPNTGEPGGGPFWVVDGDGRESVQIVETAQIDPGDPDQQTRLRQATHFNPVDLVVAVRNAEGRPHDLRSFIDPDAVIVTRKSAEGRELLALERPGLWNGAMARWNTVFVEVPLATFSPVKSVLDLLRAEHRQG